jgi:insertion element IS1 protein InsB
MVIRDAGPGCGSPQFKKNGHIHNGKQNHQCKVCGRQFVASAEDHIVSGEERTVIEHLLRERISLRGICRAVGVSLTWLLRFMLERFASCPDHLYVQLPVNPTDVVNQRLEAEADEMWNFVEKKANKQWIWIAMDAKTRQVIPFHIGDRSGESGEQLWAMLPRVYQQQATFYTNLNEVYKGVIPPTQHKAVTTKARNTNHVERFNNTLRQRISRLVRDTLSFSKKLANHIGAIKFFICHYNLANAAALPVYHYRRSGCNTTRSFSKMAFTHRFMVGCCSLSMLLRACGSE